MSHLHERKEKTCLNCGAPLVGRYCHDCGQQNLEPKESFAHILRHFAEDVTHFDGKFFSSIKLLLTKPGLLTEEYMKGRRASYLNPIRMYLFVSAVFFIVVFSLVDKGINKTFDEHPTQDTVATAPANIKSNTLEISTVRQYDSLQASISPEKRDSEIDAFISRRMIALVEYVNRDKENVKNIIFSIVHTLPKIMFVTMPLIALIFYILYYKQRQTYYYVAHGIFTLHYITTQFLVILIALPFALIPEIGWIISLCIFATMPVYLFLAMRRFYKQGFFATFVKYNYFFILYNIVTLVLLLLYITGYALTSSYTHH